MKYSIFPEIPPLVNNLKNVCTVKKNIKEGIIFYVQLFLQLILFMVFFKNVNNLIKFISSKFFK